MFIVMFVATGLVLLSYKTQTSAFLLLPELGEVSSQLYTSFDVGVAICLCFKTIAIIIRIFEQAKVDIYMIDYEKPHNQSKQVNAWRRLFVANEWQELGADQRSIQPPTLFFWFIFFWIGMGWRNFTLADPDWVRDHNEILPYN